MFEVTPSKLRPDEFPKRLNIDERPRVPVNQRVVKKFPVLSIDPTPRFDGKNWDVQITGLVENPITWSWDDFLKLPKSTVTADFHCVTGWSRLDTVWEGVLFKTIVDIVKPLSNAIAVTSYGNTFYTSSVPLDIMMEDNVILAYGLEGKPLDPDHGGPLRLVVPSIYAYKSTKWLRRLDFTAEWERGFWEQRGYHQRADPWLEERFSEQEKIVKKRRLETQRFFKRKNY